MWSEYLGKGYVAMRKRDFGPLLEVYKESCIRAGFSISTMNSEITRAKAEFAAVLFNALAPRISAFVDVVEGHKTGVDMGYPGYEDSMCFPKRFLRIEPIDFSYIELTMRLDILIEEIFFMGFIWHMIDADFPTRKNLHTVDLDRLVNEFSLGALVANIKMRDYETRTQGFVQVFNAYYGANAESFIKTELKIGWTRRGMCRSFLANLYCAGAYLGMMYDLATS